MVKLKEIGKIKWTILALLSLSLLVFLLFPREDIPLEKEKKVKWLLSSLIRESRYNFIFSESSDLVGLSLIIDGPVQEELKREIETHFKALFPETKCEIAISSFPNMKKVGGKKEGHSLLFFILFSLILFFFLGFLLYEKEPKLINEKELSSDLKNKLLDHSSLRKNEENF